MSCRSLYPKRIFFAVLMLTFRLFFVTEHIRSWSAFTQQISFAKYCHQRFVHIHLTGFSFFWITKAHIKNYQRMNEFCLFFKLHCCDSVSFSPSALFVPLSLSLLCVRILQSFTFKYAHFFTQTFFGIYFMFVCAFLCCFILHMYNFFHWRFSYCMFVIFIGKQ